MIFWYDEKAFWNAYADRKGYVLNRESSFVAANYENMMLFICELLPLNASEVSLFPYPRFFRTLKIAQVEAKRREADNNKAKGKKK